jgi:hypothetical protein
MTAKNRGHAGCSDCDGHAILMLTSVLCKFARSPLRLLLLKRNHVWFLLQPLSSLKGSAQVVLSAGLYLVPCHAWWCYRSVNPIGRELLVRCTGVVGSNARRSSIKRKGRFRYRWGGILLCPLIHCSWSIARLLSVVRCIRTSGYRARSPPGEAPLLTRSCVASISLTRSKSW